MTGAEGETKLAAPIPIAGRRHTATSSARVDYGVIKINDHHVKCLRLLAAQNIRPGLPVKIVYAVPDPADLAHCQAVTIQANITASSDLIHWSLSNLSAVKGGAAVSPESIPVGAAVVDAESGARIGILTQPGDTPVFSSFAYLNDKSSLVGAPGLHPGQMVHIHNHPIPLEGALLKEFSQRFHTTVACTPDFWADVYPVSNVEYRQWLLAHPNYLQPASWKRDEMRQPERRDNIPATGMRPLEVLAYATTKDKRMITGVEWQIAARANAPDSITTLYTEDRENLKRIMKILDGLKHYDQTETNRQALFQRLGRPNAYTRDPLPPSVINELNGFLQHIKDILTNGDENREGRGKGIEWAHMPGQITPIDWYDADVSVYGLHDVMMNAPEMLVPQGVNSAIAPKPFGASSDPYVTQVIADWNLGFIVKTDSMADGDRLSGSVAKRIVDLTPQDSFAWVASFLRFELAVGGAGWGGLEKSKGERNAPFTTSSWWVYLACHAVVQPGFRCAL